MKINTAELKRALEIVKPGLSNKELVEQSTAFAFIDGCVVTYNDEISISHPVTGIDIEGAIQAEELYKFISKLKTEEITLTIEEEAIVIKSGRSTAGFALAKEIKLPLKEELTKKGKWIPITQEFIETLKFVSLSCSKDMTNAKLTCVHINKNGFIESSDNYRVCHYKIEVPVKTFLLPESSVDPIARLKPTSISEGKGWVHFRTDEGTIISSRTFFEDFVDTSKYIKFGQEGIRINLPKNLDEILDKAIVFIKKEKNFADDIEVSITEKFLIVESKSETSWFKEKAPIQYTDEPISFALSPFLLKDIISKTGQCTLVKNLLYFNEANWIYITTVKNVK